MSSIKASVIIVSGLSGSGKSVALRTLEDLGYYCVDNLPADLVKQRGGGVVFGVKVAPSDDLVAPAGGFPSAWRFVWHRNVNSCHSG